MSLKVVPPQVNFFRLSFFMKKLLCTDLLFRFREIIQQTITFLTGSGKNSANKLKKWFNSIYYRIRLCTLSQVNQSND